MSGHRPFRSLKRKAKAMAPQVETVELPQHYDDCDSSCDGDRRETPDIIEPVQETDGWMFPKNWTDEEISDWLITHPTTPPEVETINVDPELDEGNNTEWSEAQVISALKADGTYASAIAVPPDMRDTVNADNYDPRQFILVHEDVFMNLVEATHAEAELGLENKELRKRVNALTRGMRKVNKHWAATKRELKYAKAGYNKLANSWQKHVADLEDLAAADRKRADIFATRLARRLRKARAGRDKRERQLAQANQTIQGQDHVIQVQDNYISQLERQLNGTYGR